MIIFSVNIIILFGEHYHCLFTLIIIIVLTLIIIICPPVKCSCVESVRARERQLGWLLLMFLLLLLFLVVLLLPRSLWQNSPSLERNMQLEQQRSFTIDEGRVSNMEHFMRSGMGWLGDVMGLVDM